MSPEPIVHSTLDVRTTEPALIWAKTKLRLEKLAYGERLKVQVGAGTEVAALATLAEAEGHQVIAIRSWEGGLELILERGRQDFARAYLRRQ